MEYFQAVVIEESLDYEFIDLLSDFGGYMGLFIGASILSLNASAINCLKKIITKFKGSLRSSISSEESLDPDYIESHGEMTQNDKILEVAEVFGISSTSNRIYSFEIELKNTQIWNKMQEDIERLGEKVNAMENKKKYNHRKKSKK